MRINQKIRTIIRSQDAPHPEPGVIWIYKTVQQTDEGEIEVLVMNYYENGEWKPIASTVDGHIIPSGEVTKKDLADLKELLEKEIKDVEDSSLSETEEITYVELVALRTNNKLVPGKTYRITDYVATTVQSDTRSANHPFDVIVTALSSNTLSEEAKAAIHKGDPYFGACKLNSWRIWYTLDNDTNRFAWADAAYGKGVIYRMIDEYGNDIPYDFKGIQFKRYKITEVSNPRLNPLINLPLGYKKQWGIRSFDETSYKWYYTCSRISDDPAATSWDIEVTDSSIDRAMAANIKFNSGNKSNPNGDKTELLNNVFLYGSVVFNFWKAHSNSTDPYTTYQTYPTDFHFDGGANENNTIVGWSGLNKIKGTFRNNLIIASFRHNMIDSNFQETTIFAKNFVFNIIGNAFEHNIIAGDADGLVGNIQFNTLNNYVYQNHIFVGYEQIIQSCKFGDYFARNWLEDVYLNSVIADGQITDSFITGKFLGMTINAFCSYLRIYGGTNGNTATGLDIVGNIRGVQNAQVFIQSNEWMYPDAQGMKPRRRIEADSNGNLIMSYWSESKWVRKTKELTGSNWVEIVDEETILKSPNGTKFRITVDNSGNIQSTQITE